jgi:hypothetical protein
MAIRLKDKLKLGDGLNTTSSVDTGNIDINGTADISGILTLSKSTGTLITSAAATDAFGYNGTAGKGHYIRGTANTYIYGGGKFYDGSTTHTLLHDGSTISTDQISNLSGTNTGDQTIPTDFVSAANGGTFANSVNIADIIDGEFTALRLMNQKTYGSGTGTNEKVRFVMGISESGYAYDSREGFAIDFGIGAESDSSDGVVDFKIRDGGTLGTYQTVQGSNKSVSFVGNLNTDANLDTSGTLTWAKNQTNSYTYSAADATGMYIERVSTAGAGSTLADIRLQARNNNSGAYSVVRVKGSDNTIHLTAADTLISGNLAVEGNNLFLGKNGADPRIDMLYVDHASGPAWDTRIFIGKSDNLPGASGTFPTYTPAGAYGIQFQANSDGVFFGMEEYSTGNYRPIIQWGDDNTDTPFRIKHENGSELEVSMDGQVTATTKFIAPTLTSTVATGTAPLTVTSTTKVTNLNAHYFDGASTSYFLNTSSTGQTKTGALDVGALKIDGKKVLDLPSNAGSDRGPWNPIVTSIKGSGKTLNIDEEFLSGNNGVSVYNNQGGDGVVITRETDDTTLGATAPNDSGYVLKIVHNGNSTSPGHGGFVQNIPSEANHTFVQIFQAKLDTGRSLVYAENSQGSNNSSYWLTDTAGTGKWEWYARVSHCGNTGTFHGGGHVYVSGGTSSFTWYLASCTIIDVTDSSGEYLRLTGGVMTGNAHFTDPTTAGTSAKIQFGTNTSWNNNIGIESYWMVLGSNQNEGFKFKDSTGNMLLQLNGGNSATGNGTLSSTFGGSLTATGDITSTGNLYLGSTGTQNFIAFKGTTGDSTADYTTTYIGEYLYGGTEQSELILYKGNDGHSDSSGYDRIRMIGANLCFDVYNIAQSYPTTLSAVSALATTRAMTISQVGNVGIGTTTPARKLSVYGSGTSFTTAEIPTTIAAVVSNQMTDNNYHSILQLVAVRASLSSGQHSNGYLGFSTIDDSNNQGVRDAGRIAIVNENGTLRNSPTALTFWTNAPGGSNNTTPATEKMRITSGGTVGIGTTSASHMLTVSSPNNSVLKLVNTELNYNANQQSILFQGVWWNGAPGALTNIARIAGTHYSNGYHSGGLNFYSYNNGTEINAMTIKHDGHVGIGTSTPKGALDVKGNFVVDTKTLTLTNTFSDALTVVLSSHKGCYVKITVFGDWSGHSSVSYLGEFFLNNGADGYNEPGMIIRQVDGTHTDAIEAQIVDPTGNSGNRDFTIQLKTTATASFTAYLTYTIQGMFVSAS